LTGLISDCIEPPEPGDGFFYAARLLPTANGSFMLVSCFIDITAAKSIASLLKITASHASTPHDARSRAQPTMPLNREIPPILIIMEVLEFR
jgi:hypothetical protein